MSDYWHFNLQQQGSWAMDSLRDLHGKFVYIVNQACGSCCVVRGNRGHPEVCGRGEMGPNAQWEVMKIDMHDMDHPIVGFRHVRTGMWLMLKNYGIALSNGAPQDLDHCKFVCEHNMDHTFTLVKFLSMRRRKQKMLGFS